MGNGFTKLFSEHGSAIIASYFAPINTKDINNYEAFDSGAVVEIIASSNTALNNTKWLVGETAIEYYPDSYRQVVDFLSGKQSYAVPLILGAIATANMHHKCVNYQALASIHDSQVFGNELRTSINGTHKAKLNNGIVQDINLDAKVGEEGIGAIASIKGLPRGSVGLIDLGHGTTITSVFRRGRLLDGSRKIINYGVHQLCEAIAKHPDTRRSLGKEASLHLVRQGLKNNFDYGSTDFNFRDIYMALIRSWISSCLSPSFKFLQPRLESLDGLYLTGGGAMLPHVADIAAKKDVIRIANPQLAEAIGLHILSNSVFGGL